ncbi:antirestriction protein [Escherichia coli]|nr:antirestriction protein [Escherichia coli]
MRQQQDEPGRFSICSRQAAVVLINRQLWLYHDSGDAGLTHLYRMRDAQLWSHIEFHPECNAIYAALD